MTAAQQQQMQQAQVQAQQQQQQQVRQGQQVPIQPGPPKPEALAVAKFLKSQNLKSRPAIFQEKRKEMFKGMHGLTNVPSRLTVPDMKLIKQPLK